MELMKSAEEATMCFQLFWCDDIDHWGYISVRAHPYSPMNSSLGIDNINMKDKTDMCLSWTFLFALVMRFGNFSHRPSSSCVHSWPALLLLQTLNPAVSQHSSEKPVYGLLTSKECFQSVGVSFHFQVSAQVNTAIHVGAICRDGHTAVTPSAKTTYETEGWSHSTDGKKNRDNSSTLLATVYW